MAERYAPEGAAPDYRHSFHAGNVGDVWKHVALVTWLDVLVEKAAPIDVLDTHAGDGFYRFQSTGEYTAGIGRLWDLGKTVVPAVDRYVERVGALTGGDRRSYPGSPALIASALRSHDTATFCETRPDACAALRRVVGPSGTVLDSDGFAAIPAPARDAADGRATRRRFTHIDPPYVQKPEWDATADAIAKAAKGGGVLAWYPVKSLTRPNAMLARLRATGTAAVAVELWVTPLQLERKALAGSGLVLVGAPPSVLAAVHAAATVLGPACATHEGQWFVRTTAFG